MKFLKITFFATALGLSFFLGWVAAPEHVSESTDGLWTCSMHPEVQRRSPGTCQVCAMYLVRETTLQS